MGTATARMDQLELQCENPKCALNLPSLDEQISRVLDEVPGGGEASRIELLARIILDEAMRNRDPKLLIALLDRLWPKPGGGDATPEQPRHARVAEPDLARLSDDELRSLSATRKRISQRNAETD